MNKPRILITNDDGILSKGIFTLWKALEQFSDVTIIAPKNEQSGKSHSISLHKPLRIKYISHNDGFEGYAVNGTPVDCVKIGLNKFFKKKPDLIVSGINKGANVGKNILYSGTVAAAMEGILNDIPSIAFSINSSNPSNLKTARIISRDIVQQSLKGNLSSNIIINVNIPNCKIDQIKETIITKQGHQYFVDSFKEKLDSKNNNYFLMGGKIKDLDEDIKYDGYAVANNYVSITPLKTDITSHSHISLLKNFFN